MSEIQSDPGDNGLRARAEVVAQFLRTRDPYFAPFATALDFSPKSLEAIDAFLGQLYGSEGTGPSESFDQMPSGKREVVLRLGIYVAEVIRRAVNGFWNENRSNYLDSRIATPSGVLFSPFVAVYDRITEGEKKPLTATLAACGYEPALGRTSEQFAFMQQLSDASPEPSVVSRSRLDSAHRAIAASTAKLAVEAVARKRRNRWLLASGAGMFLVLLLLGVSLFKQIGILGTLALLFLWFGRS